MGTSGDPARTALIERARVIAGDRDSGSSEIAGRALPLLADAIAAGADAVTEIVRIVCRGQPSMAALWNICAAAAAEQGSPGAFARVRAEVERAPAALERAAVRTLVDTLGDDPRPVITHSYSGQVQRALGALARRRPLHVICGEGRPRYEGRRMAGELAAAGASATLVVDAALSSYLGDAGAVVVGADAIVADAWINKVGTFGLAAAASLTGTPVYVVASRDKALPPALATRFALATGSPREVAGDVPPGVELENRYFEMIPAALATLFLTDAGPISPAHTSELGRRWSLLAAALLPHLG